MARTKQTARKSKGNVSAADGSAEEEEDIDEAQEASFWLSSPPPPPSPPPKMQMQSINDGVPLTNILSPAVLLKQKESLKNLTLSPVQLDREGLLESASDFGPLPLVPSLEYMRTQSHTADVTALNFSGTDQMMDIFFYLIHAQNIMMPKLTSISLNGCYNISDAGVKWMTRAFSAITQIELCGCKKVTEQSLLHIINAWGTSISMINVSSTGVGLIPPHYEGSIKLNGCPLVSPTETLYRALSVNMSEKMNRPTKQHDCYKMVIFTDDSVPWSPLALMTKEKDVKARNSLTIKQNVKIDSAIINMFEVPLRSGFGDLVITPGSIVVLPYLLYSDGPDPDYPDTLVDNMIQVFIKCPDCVFVLLGLTNDTGPELESVASRYRNLITSLFKKTTDLLERELDFSVQGNTLTRHMTYYMQECYKSGHVLLDHSENITTSATSPANGSTFTLLVSSMMQIDSDISSALKKMIHEATGALHHHYPWHFIPYQMELQMAIAGIELIRFGLTNLKQIAEMVCTPSSGMNCFSKHPELAPYINKILELMGKMGKLLYFPNLESGCALSDFIFLEKFYTTLMTKKSTRRATWRFLGSNIPCWLPADLEKMTTDKKMLELFVKLLENNGLLLRLPRDTWTVEIEDVYAYVLTKDLPSHPVVDLEDLWPESVSFDECQIERYFTFLPGIPETFFPMVIKQFLELGGVRLLWNKGIVIQKGPVTLLTEMLCNYDNIPVLFFGVRLINANNDNINESPLCDTVWGLLKIYRAIIQGLFIKHHIYSVESAPCRTCLPSKNRYKSVNARDSEVWFIKTQLLATKAATQRPLTCKNDGTNVDIEKLLGPDLLSLYQITPAHYYLGCQPSFSAYNRCMFCHYCAHSGPFCGANLINGRSSWNCSCENEGQMCDNCGMCQRCVTILSHYEGLVLPKFQKKGSALALQPGTAYTCEQELTPNCSPILEIHLVRGAIIDIEVKIGATKLTYNTGEGTITEIELSDKPVKQSNDKWICHEGFNITVHASFVDNVYDDMKVEFRVRGVPIYTYMATTQGCVVSVSPANPIFVVIYMPNAKRIPEQKVDEFGEKSMCSYAAGSKLLPSAIEAMLTQGRQYVENAVFQVGGINYSGSSFITLPQEISMDKLKYPSYNLIKESLAFHLLCYTRSKVSDLLTFSGGQAVPETWNVYRMIHLLDNEGIKLSSQRQHAVLSKATDLLWGWHFLFKLNSKIVLPKVVTKFLPKDVCTPDTLSKVETGLYDLLELTYWSLVSRLNLDNILSKFEDTAEILSQTLVLQNVTKDHFQQTGMTKVVSQFNTDNLLYLCPGHHASVKVEEGITQVLPEIYGSYSIFLLSVNMPSNQLSAVPEDMFQALPNLAEFDCSNNFLEALPSSVRYCKKLYSLSLAENNLTDLPDSLQECKGLYRLDITSNMMDILPPVVMKLTQLQRLYASNMFMTSLPDDIGNLVNLEKLYVNGNCFTKLPKSFRNLRNLNDLGISGVPWLSMSKGQNVMSYDNFVTKLGMWRMDRWLEEHKEEKEALFKFFDEDSNGVLDMLEIGKLNAALFNMFPRFGYKGIEPPDDDTPSGFPEEILDCTNLEYISLFYQGIVSIPPAIGSLQELKILNISHNPNLLSVPAEVGTISSLIRLEMEECPLLKTPPKEIRAKGFSATFAYLGRLLSGSLPCKRTKLMLVGLGGAGKTSLVNALLSKDGKANLSLGEAITDGIDICTWTVKAGEEALTYSVWDFAGQTVYYNTHQFFLSNRAVYLLLWNVRLGYEHAGLEFWLSSISVQAPKAPIFLVGSHIDKVSKFELPINEMRERYKQIAGFHFVSSLTGQGMKELQEHLFDVTLQQQYMGEQIPEVWLTLENTVISARSSMNIIDYSALEKLANISGIFEKAEIYQAVQFLHELGSLQHFTTETLKSKVVVNPQWIVDVMACIVSVKNSHIKNGRLQHSDISFVWKDYPANLHEWLLKLTEVYDLTFPLEGEPVNLVPCLLPEVQPEFSWPEIEKDSEVKENKMIYKFDYLPAGLFNRGQVRLHQISDSVLIWKSGSYLKRNGHIALLQQTRNSELKVQVQGPRPENVIFLVHEVFEGLISESFRGVTYDYLLPCPDCLKMVVKDPHMFAASTIRRALEMKAPFLQCVKYFHTVSCIDLLACMPPDNHSDFDLHLVQSVRNLRDLRKDLSADIFMSYCSKDIPQDHTIGIHPAMVFEELQALGYKCWFPVKNQTYSIEEVACVMNDASVFVVFISSDYVKDEECVNTFKYARLTLHKPIVMIAVGEGFEWKQSRLGILLADEVFINMTKSKQDVFKSKCDELVHAINSKINKRICVDAAPSCFFSYSWVNSAKAVELGTKEVPGAIGHGDPRGIKDYLENNGIRCWIDVERVGQNGLFDDIGEGLLSAKLVVVCISDEYASSPMCRVEFRYATSTLKLPIILAVVGTGNKWRATEVGVLSLRYPIVSFQEKSETAYSTLLSLVKSNMKNEESEKDRKNKQSQIHKNLSYQELFELAQRKLLRQLSFYAEHQDVDMYPRLFAVDFLKTKSDEKTDEERGSSGPKALLLSKKMSELKAAFRIQKYCVYTLCEHDEGWHSVTEPIKLQHDFGETLLEKFTPFIARVTAVMKYNKHFTFMCIEDELGEDYFKWLEENPQATLSDYQNIYHEFRKMVVDADSQRTMGKLARCRLPNGKTIWLCEKHQNSMKVTVLGSEAALFSREIETDSTDNMHMILGLRSLTEKTFPMSFTSSRTAKRRILENMTNDKKTTNMYSTFELLPDKKTPKPSVLTKTKSRQNGLDNVQNDSEKIDTATPTANAEKVTNVNDNNAYGGEDVRTKTVKLTRKDKLQLEMKNKRSGLLVDSQTVELNGKKSIKDGKSLEHLTETEVPRLASKAKTFYGHPSKELVDVSESASGQPANSKPVKNEVFAQGQSSAVKPDFFRSKTQVPKEKPKSKACNIT